jgi:hypothetical protein
VGIFAQYKYKNAVQLEISLVLVFKLIPENIILNQIVMAPIGKLAQSLQLSEKGSDFQTP